MIGHDLLKGNVLSTEAWITTSKNRYCSGERIVATLHKEGLFPGTNIMAMLTDSDGKTTVLEAIGTEHDSRHFYIETDASGAYTLVCAIDSNTAAQYICSTCFFVGDCEAAIPKIPAVPLLFVPEIWEDPDYFKLISLFLVNNRKTVPNMPVVLLFRNRSGSLEKKLSTDSSGNVFFSPYMAGMYCLIGKMIIQSSDGEYLNITTSFSIFMNDREGEKARAKKSEPGI